MTKGKDKRIKDAKDRKPRPEQGRDKRIKDEVKHGG